MNNKHLSWYKEINNNFIIASRAYFLQQELMRGAQPERGKQQGKHTTHRHGMMHNQAWCKTRLNVVNMARVDA